MKKSKFLVFAAAAFIAFAAISCQRGVLDEVDDAIPAPKEYCREFKFTASSVGPFDNDWKEYFNEHFGGMMAPGFASSASVTFLDNALLVPRQQDVLDFIGKGKICVIVNPDDNLNSWLAENLPEISAVYGDMAHQEIVFTAITNDAVFIQHKDDVEEFDPKEHRAPGEEVEDEGEDDQQEPLDDPLNYQLLIEWMEEVVNDHFMDASDTKADIELPGNEEYHKAKHYPKRTDTYKHVFKMTAKRLSYDLPIVNTSGEVAVEYTITPLYCYQGQGPQDPGDYYLVERDLKVNSSDTEKWHGGRVRKWGAIRWYARGGYLFEADVTTTLKLNNTKYKAAMVGQVSPLTKNNVATYTSNFSESMGVKIAPSIGGNKSAEESKGQNGGNASLGDLFNWGRSYSHGKSASLTDFSITNHTMEVSPVRHLARYAEEAFPFLNEDKTCYGKAADLATSVAVFPSHWIWHISGTSDDMTGIVGGMCTKLKVTWGWSHRSSNSRTYDPIHPYHETDWPNKSTFVNKEDTLKLINLPAPTRTSSGRIVIHNDTDDQYIYGVSVYDKDSVNSKREINTGSIAPGKEIILTALQNKPQKTPLTPIKYVVECRMGPNGQNLETYKYYNDQYGDSFSISKCLNKDNDSFHVSMVSDMIEKN